MRLIYDRRGDSLTFRLRNGPVHHSEEVEDGVYLLFDPESRVVGFQIDRARSHLSLEDLLTVTYENLETHKRSSVKLP